MKVIRPVEIVDANFISSDVAEDDHPLWNAGTTYAVGARVIRATTHRRYESLVAGNVGSTPEADPTKWLDLGPTNRWAMFDKSVGTNTVREAELTIEVQPGSVDTLTLLDADAETVEVTMTVGATVVYNEEQSFNTSGVPITDWYAYFFEEVGRTSVAIFDDLPAYPTAVIKVHVMGGGAVADVSVGTLIVGRSADLGSAEHGIGLGITDYSRKVTDDFGATNVVQRGFSRRMTIRTMFNTDQIDATHRLLAGLRATPVLWLGAPGFESLAIYGFYKDFDIDLAYPTVSYCSLTIEGLTQN